MLTKSSELGLIRKIFQFYIRFRLQLLAYTHFAYVVWQKSLKTLLFHPPMPPGYFDDDSHLSCERVIYFTYIDMIISWLTGDFEAVESNFGF